jgi:hypothetical protein
MLLNEFLKEHRMVEQLEAALCGVNERLAEKDAKIQKVTAQLANSGGRGGTVAAATPLARRSAAKTAQRVGKRKRLRCLYLRLRRLLPSSSEKPIHLFAPSASIAAIVFGEADPPLMRRARDTPATTAVKAAVSAATFKILQATPLPLQTNRPTHFSGSHNTTTPRT